ncbi:hypothetical protein HaLaN_17412, partial [Haematococcus lacustris]
MGRQPPAPFFTAWVCGHTSTAYDPFLDLSLDLVTASQAKEELQELQQHV